MFISISKTGGGRYVFCVGEDPKDEIGACLTSYGDSSLLGDIPPTFSSYGEAHARASRLVDERPSCVLAKKASFFSSNGSGDAKMMAEGDVIGHYGEQTEIVGQRLAFILGTNVADRKEELDAVGKEIEGIKEEVGRMIEMSDESGRKPFEEVLKKLEGFLHEIAKVGGNKTASSSSGMTMGLRKSAIRAFSEAAMLAVHPSHPDVFVKGATFFPETGKHVSVLSSAKGDLIRLSFDRNFLLSGIIPCQAAIKECGGEHSVDFFLKYWEPIVNSVGHFYSKGTGVVAVAGMDQSKRNAMMAFSMTDSSKSMLEVNRMTVLGRKTWMMAKKAATVTAPPDSDITIGDEVECVNPSLPTYVGRTGAVDEVSKKSDRMLYRVDFRRGIGPIWMEDKSVRKFDLGT